VEADATLAGTTLVPTVAVVPDAADRLGAVAVLNRDRRTRLARRNTAQPRAIDDEGSSQMEDLSRRQLLIAASAATAVGGLAAGTDIASAHRDDGNGGRPVLEPTPEDYRFPLASTTPQIVRQGGSITKAVPENFPVLKDNEVSAGYLVLEPGALREPHWHPTHWELDYAVQGEGELGIVTPDDQQNITRLKPGDIGFIPLGWAHYIRNVGSTELIWVLVFNNPLTDIGLSTMFGGMPTNTFTQTLGTSLAGAVKPKETRFIV